MFFLCASAFSTVIQFFLLCWFIAKNKYKVYSEITFLSYLFFSGLYCLFMSLFWIEKNPDAAMVNLKYALSSAAFLPICVSLFSTSFIRQQFTLRNLLEIFLSIPFLLFFLNNWESSITGISPLKLGWCYNLDKRVSIVWVIYFIVYGVGVFVHFNMVAKTLKNEGKLELKKKFSYIIYAFIALAALFAISNLSRIIFNKGWGTIIPSSFFFVPSIFMAYALMGGNGKKR